MFRLFWRLGIVAVLAAIAIWMADRPGTISLHWGGWRIDTSVAVLAVVTGIIAIIIAWLIRLWAFGARVPKKLIDWRTDDQRRRGYVALTRGMVAVAAGDAREARRQAGRAEALQGDPALTLLMAAQTAQLNGDEDAAAGYFTNMLDRPETEFLGVRGLLTQALKYGDAAAAMELALRAHRLRPDSAWVCEQLFALQVGGGRWIEAANTLNVASKLDQNIPANGCIGANINHTHAVLALIQSRKAEDDGRPGEALKFALKASKRDPGFAAAIVRAARLLIDAGKKRKAVTVLRNAWRLEPHPDFPSLYFEARDESEPLDKVRAAQQLASENPNHDESHIAVAQTALEAQLWGEARKHLQPMAAFGASARVCRLMAALEDSEHADHERAKAWRDRMAMATPDPAWVCARCGNVAHEWTPHCGNCQGFDGLAWRLPPHVSGLHVTDLTEPASAPLVIAAAKSGDA